MRMFKSSGMQKKISHSELKKMLYELHDYIDPKQKEMILDMYPNGILSKREFLLDLYSLRKEGKISEVDQRKIKELIDKYWDNYVESL